jgi:hypothetical protein
LQDLKRILTTVGVRAQIATSPAVNPPAPEEMKTLRKGLVLSFGNLPFAKEAASSDDVLQENHGNSAELHKNLDSDVNKRLAQVYEEQGNKLAEV